MMYEPRVLIVDDDAAATEALVRALRRRDTAIDFQCFCDGAAALRAVRERRPEAVVLDLSLDPVTGPVSGFELLSGLLDVDAALRVLVLTGHDSVEHGVHALERGAASFIGKPVDPDHLLALLRDAVAYALLRRNLLQAQSSAALAGLTTKNDKMAEVLATVSFAATTNQPVLLAGETGCGKGVIAQAIHKAHSKRSRGPFIRFQPGFSGHDLTASELFGHQRGAFTGAAEARAGLIEEASGGTLFIDEVDELPVETQVLLLNVLQEKVYRRLGSNRELRSDFRLIAATNRELKTLVPGKLRRDFYHRIAHCLIEVPALRERPEDIQDLAEEMLRTAATRDKLAVQGFAASAAAKLLSYSWPGNVRELQAAVEGGAYRAHYEKRRFVEPADLRITGKCDGLAAGSLRMRVRAFEEQLVAEALARCGNNQTLAAKNLCLDRTSLRRILGRARCLS